MVSGFVSDKNKTKAVQYKLSGHNSSALSSETVPAGQTECRENYGQMPHAMLKNTAQAEKYRAKPLTSQQTQTTMNTEANRKTEWVVGIGEALWDILPEGRKIGGAPANFAYHMSQFGLRSCAARTATCGRRSSRERRRSSALRAVCPRVLRRSRRPTLSFGLLRYSLSFAFAAKLTVLLDIFPLARCFSTWREAFGRNFRGIRFVLPGRFPTTGRTNYARKVCIERLLSYFCLTQNPKP